LIGACLFAFPACAKYSGGSGTAQDPYQIATAADLIALGETPEDYSKHFKLVANIDLDPKLPGRKVFDTAVIAAGSFRNNKYNPFSGTPFTGVFDGNKHTIAHLTITGKDCLGLFGDLRSGAPIKNLGIVDVNIAGSGYYAGALVGHNEGGSVTQCYSTGVVRAEQYVGGLVGENHGHVTQCYSIGTVKGTYVVGGLAGSNDGGSMTQCYSTGTVSGDTTVGGLIAANWGWGTVSWCYSTAAASGTLCAGGLVGWNEGTVVQCYSTGAVSGEDAFGGLVGHTKGIVIGCLWDMQTSGQAESAAGTGKTTAGMQTRSTFLDTGWGFVAETQNGTPGIWQMPPGSVYPVLAIFNGYIPPQLQGSGTEEDPYLVSSASELGTMVYGDLHAHYRLVAPVDLSGSRWNTPVVPWFAGTFDGDSHTISHLTIAGGGYLGLFGRLLSGAEIKNLGVSDVNIVGLGDSVGGLVGENDRGTVTQCHSTGAVRSTGDNVGGLMGETHYGTVTQCYSTGVVTGAGQVAGLVGSNNYGTMTCCYSTGTVNGTNDVGGLVGRNDWGTVTQCYSTGAVRGTGQVGGLVGSNNDGTMTRCYSTGAVSGKADVGGLVGSTGNPSYVTASFWDTQTSGQTKSAAGTAKTTAEMEKAETFADVGWDFVGVAADSVWWILEGKDYPRLGWQCGRASALAPQEGAASVSRQVVLRWIGGGPGFWQDVYLGSDEVAVADVTSQTPGVYRTRQASEITTYDPGILEWGKTYYWRIDEVKSNDPAAGSQGTVWSFSTTACIKSPRPPDIGVDVVQPAVLSWVPGEPGLQYDVYLGDNAEKVTGATPQTAGIYRGRQASEATTYKAGDLELNTTYYWRIDGVDKARLQSPWRGTVWRFTTGIGVALVDDFESYTDDEGARLYETWIDGWTNGTSSTVGNDVAPFTEQTVVHGGKQSMPMGYDNRKKPWYSEAQRTWATPQDWTVRGADTLTLYFRGKASNGRDPLYVGIQASTGPLVIVIHSNAEAARTTEWQTWHIPLATMRAAGANIAAVRKMVIGVGDRKNPKAGGTGQIYIDDIRLTKRSP
jgi:hypothetical protein